MVLTGRGEIRTLDPKMQGPTLYQYAIHASNTIPTSLTCSLMFVSDPYVSQPTYHSPVQIKYGTHHPPPPHQPVPSRPISNHHNFLTTPSHAHLKGRLYFCAFFKASFRSFGHSFIAFILKDPFTLRGQSANFEMSIFPSKW